MVHIKKDVSRYLDFELLNRTIIWNILSDFFIYFLPYIKDLSITKTFKNLFLFTTFLGSISSEYTD